jgi:hypothetical protein
MGPTEYSTTILLLKPSQNLPRVSLLEADFVVRSQNVNSSWCREQREGDTLTISRTRFRLSDVQVLWSCHCHLCISALLPVIRNLAVAALPWMLDLWNSRRTVFVETTSSRLMFSSVVTCATVVVWFSKQSFSIYDGSASVNVDFRPLFLFADVVFPWVIYANVTLETVVVDTPNNVAVLSQMLQLNAH